MATDNDFDDTINKPTAAEIAISDSSFTKLINQTVEDLNGLMQRASVTGLKTDIEVITRHHIGAVAAPVIRAQVSRQL